MGNFNLTGADDRDESSDSESPDHKLYLTGALSDGDSDDPFKWHDEVSDTYGSSDTEFVNPYTLNEFELGDDTIYDKPERVVEPALDEIRASDVLLVRWDDDIFLIGSAMEILYANIVDTPVVIWYDGWRDNLSPWLLYTSHSIFEDRDRALTVAMTLAGDDSQLTESL